MHGARGKLRISIDLMEIEHGRARDAALFKDGNDLGDATLGHPRSDHGYAAGGVPDARDEVVEPVVRQRVRPADGAHEVRPLPLGERHYHNMPVFCFIAIPERERVVVVREQVAHGSPDELLDVSQDGGKRVFAQRGEVLEVHDVLHRDVDEHSLARSLAAEQRLYRAEGGVRPAHEVAEVNLRGAVFHFVRAHYPGGGLRYDVEREPVRQRACRPEAGDGDVN